MSDPKLAPKGRKLRKEWIAALESGKYQQGKGNLRARSKGKLKYCCMGVLCNLVDPKKWTASIDNREGSRQVFEFSSLYIEQPPREISKLVGLSHDHIESLMFYNDEYGLNFKQIAKILKTNNFIKPLTDEWYDFLESTKS